MPKTRVREITIAESGGTFALFKKTSVAKDAYDFEGIAALRNLLSNEKARILHAIKTQKPSSIYELAKKLNRTFKSVYGDLKVLERFGFIELSSKKHKNRTRNKPEIIVDTITIHLKI